AMLPYCRDVEVGRRLFGCLGNSFLRLRRIHHCAFGRRMGSFSRRLLIGPTNRKVHWECHECDSGSQHPYGNNRRVPVVVWLVRVERRISIECFSRRRLQSICHYWPCRSCGSLWCFITLLYQI